MPIIKTPQPKFSDTKTKIEVILTCVCFISAKDVGTEGVGTSLSIFIRDENVMKLISRNRTSRQSFANFGRTRTKINIVR